MRSVRSGLARLLRAPPLHFMVIGGLLYLAHASWPTAPVDQDVQAAAEPLVFTARQVEQLRADLTVQNGFPPSRENLRAAVEEAIDDEVLYRQALAIGLDRGNASVRQRLVQIAGFVSEDPDQDEEALYQSALRLGLDRSDLVVRRLLASSMRLVAENVPLADEAPPGEDELRAYLDQHAEAFATPWRVRFNHLFLSGDERGDVVGEDARQVLAELRAGGLTPEQASTIGDPFLLGDRFYGKTGDELRQMFGAPFADALAALEAGQWSEPVPSPYGWHLVWVEEVRPARLPPLAEIREEVLAAALAQRRERRVEETMKEMRARYAIRVEAPWVSQDAGPTGEEGRG
ncbi:peptidyl-prolyl cis-trans isomerase [Geminicoccus roseus]|uniref:peptidylprolyl isomerase n=1 Tax=Geminicoccus roseus TaxID=404900 RepID=UPI000422DD34|nr:peptidyl-prolyl cis-trans isomerase [Geminicoccus roseus]